MDINGSVLSFHDINYTVQVRPAGKLIGKKHPKEIIKNVNGIFKPGINAILGPTGSGKTSLLDILAGRKDPTGLTGNILVDGAAQPKNFRCMTGYVVQDDVVMGTLTVRENLMFSANVRLSSDISKEEKERRVDEVIRELGLTHCADTKVGTEFIRGISGGERKRTNIGMELIIAPSVLFLDEPTTGLDASTANAVIALLRRLGKKGKTIILSIHQPRFSIYRMFDSLMLLSLGKTVYHGPSDEALDFFSQIGYECEAHNNPPDFFLDVINGDSSAISTIGNNTKSGLNINAVDNMEQGSARYTNGIYSKRSTNDMQMREIESTETNPETREESLSDTLHKEYMSSSWNKEIEKEMKSLYNNYKNNSKISDVPKGEYQTGYFTQLKYLAQRTLRNAFRNPQTTIVQFLIMIIFALIVGILYLQISDLLPEGRQNRVGAFFFIVMNMIFGNMAAVELFIKERAIFIHEHANGFYRVSAYYISKILCDIIPLRVVPAVIFSLIVYFMIGFQAEADKFFLFTLCLILTSTTSTGVGIFVSAGVGVFAIAQLLIAMIYVFMMRIVFSLNALVDKRESFRMILMSLYFGHSKTSDKVFGGVLINIESIWAGIRWLQYFSLFRYAINFLCINELKGLTFYIEREVNGTTEIIDAGFAGEALMRDLGIPFETDWDFYSNLLALFLMTTGFLLLGYIMMRRAPRWK